MRDGRMHQTTVRFSPDLWSALEAECSRLGISAAQYVREAALARLSYTAGRRGEDDYGFALVEARVPAQVVDGREPGEQALAAAAVSAQSEQVRRRAREVREQAAALRRRRREME